MKHLNARSNVLMTSRVLALAVLTTFAAVAQPSGPLLVFEVASVRRAEPDPKLQACLCEPPGRVAYRAAPLKWIIERGIKLQDSQIDGPGWLDDTTFDIDAKLPEGASRADVPVMLRTLLQERFHLMAHVESRETSAFVLTIASGGTKLKPPADDWDYGWQQDKTGIHRRQRSDMKDLASYLSTQLDRPVVDETRIGRSVRSQARLRAQQFAHPVRKPRRPGPSVARRFASATWAQTGIDKAANRNSRHRPDRKSANGELRRVAGLGQLRLCRLVATQYGCATPG